MKLHVQTDDFNIAGEALVPSLRDLRGWLKCNEIWKYKNGEVLEVVEYLQDDCFDPFKKQIF